MTTLDTLRECHRIVWQYRRELEAVWPTPDRLDSLRFATTEAAEALDAWLRMNGTYARNRAKDLSVLDELADCALMLITALGAKAEARRVGSVAVWADETPEELVSYVAVLTGIERNYQNGIGASLQDSDLWRAVRAIADVKNMDLPARLTARLERIKAKRLPPSEASDLDLEYTWLNQAGSL